MYDYIVVGGGTAGCVVASRLSEDRSARVLLLEAGAESGGMEANVPAAWPMLFNTDLDWKYKSTPQSGMANRSIYLPRGKGLGGCSATSAMMYIRGHIADYDGWAALGCAGWGFEDTMKFFARSETNERGGSDWHGDQGPLVVSDLRRIGPGAKAFVEACGQTGIEPTPDFNGPDLAGAGFPQATIHDGARCSTASAYIDLARERKNLVIETGALVERVTIEGRRANGVAYRRDGKRSIAHAAREVIVAAGAYNSPQVLMLSGIGPGAHLQKHGINVVCNQPGVGQGLREHVVCGLFYACPKKVTMFGATSMVEKLRYRFGKSGMLASNACEAAAFVRTQPGLPAPNLELLYCDVLYFDEGLTAAEEHGFTLASILLQPKSVGQVTLATPQPTDAPRIDPGFLSDPEGHDLGILMEGLKLGRKIVEAGPMKPFAVQELRPGDGVLTDADLADYVRRRAHHMYHPVGTCRMGVDPGSVVDPQLRVRGVDGLRVMDASIMPTIPRGHTLAATVMIAEKGAEMVRAERPVKAE